MSKHELLQDQPTERFDRRSLRDFATALFLILCLVLSLLLSSNHAKAEAEDPARRSVQSRPR